MLNFSKFDSKNIILRKRSIQIFSQWSHINIELKIDYVLILYAMGLKDRVISYFQLYNFFNDFITHLKVPTTLCNNEETPNANTEINLEPSQDETDQKTFSIWSLKDSTSKYIFYSWKKLQLFCYTLFIFYSWEKISLFSLHVVYFLKLRKNPIIFVTLCLFSIPGKNTIIFVTLCLYSIAEKNRYLCGASLHVCCW